MINKIMLTAAKLKDSHIDALCKSVNKSAEETVEHLRVNGVALDKLKGG